MNIVFSAISASSPEYYLAEKLRACRKNCSAARIQEIRQNLGAVALPLASTQELPTLTDSQSRLIEINKKEVLDNLSRMVPPVAGETVSGTSFSLLTKKYQNFAANTPVLTVTSNFSTLHYLFGGFTVHGGVLKETAPLLPMRAPGAGLPGSAMPGLELNLGSLIETLAESLLSEGMSAIAGKLVDWVTAQFFKSKEVQELEQYVKQAIEQNDIDNCRTNLDSVLSWISTSYEFEKTKWSSLNTQLVILTEQIMPKLARYRAAFPVYALAANTALLFCKQMDTLPDAPDKKIPTYAPQCINVLTQLMRSSLEARAGWVTFTEDAGSTGITYEDNFKYQLGPFYNFPACHPDYDSVCLQAEHGKLVYVRDVLYAEFTKTYASCITSVHTWCDLIQQTIKPNFTISDTLFGMTNDYLPFGGGLISADGAYCLLYCQNTDTGADGQLPGQLVVFSVANGKSVWRSNSSGNGWRTYMQQDVNFVAYRDVPAGWQGSGLDSNPNQVIWDLYPCPPSNKGDAYLSANNSVAFSSKTGKDTKQPLNYCIVMQNDGNLVIYPTGRTGPSNAVWASGSNQ